jgi:hypothetical protein
VFEQDLQIYSVPVQGSIDSHPNIPGSEDSKGGFVELDWPLFLAKT